MVKITITVVTIIVVTMIVTMIVIIKFEWDQVVTGEIGGRGAGHKLLSRRTSFHHHDHGYHHDHADDNNDEGDDNGHEHEVTMVSGGRSAMTLSVFQSAGAGVPLSFGCTGKSLELSLN